MNTEEENKKVTEEENKKCPDCKGTGRDNVPYGERCDRCGGKGKIK